MPAPQPLTLAEAAPRPAVREPASPGAPAGARQGFRRDVQGLRAVAVLLVLAFHAGLPVPGGFVGVDVFFVVSGFLITGLVADEVARTGRLRLGRFYARRARRLLPAAALTLVTVVVATTVWLPVTRWRDVAGDVVATSLYVVNWRLADRSVDYLAQDAAASPVQHFWSLAVEEQFYVVWPLLVVALVALARLRGRPASRRGLVLGVAAIGAASLAWSVALTVADPSRAYFVTTTRAWELAAGALLALLTHRVTRLPQRVLLAGGWCGLALVAVAAFTLNGSTPFPGVAALPPVGGTVLVLAAGLVGPGLRPLTARVLQPVGATSYSLYLWHWPAVVLATSLTDGPPPTSLLVVAVALSVLPAVASYVLVEKPLHTSARLRASAGRSAVLGVVCTLVGVLAAGLLLRAVAAAPDHSAPGAAVLRDGTWTGPDQATDLRRLVPALADATLDVADLYAGDCHQNALGTDPAACTFGDEDASTVVALVGDSHAGQWQPPLAAIAREQGWRLDTYTKGSCALTSAPTWLGTVDGPYTQCTQWNAAVVEHLLADPPDVVVTSNNQVEVAADDGSRLTGAAGDEVAVAGLQDTWRTLADAGITVLVVGDTPWVGIDVPECVARHEGTWATECSVPSDVPERRSGLAQQRAAAAAADVPLLDLTAHVCPDGTCPAIVGGVLVWRDVSHVTASYVRTLEPELRDWLLPLVPTPTG
ncbi:acyltransferase family protein [Cellulomonas palmilytica]|uniref:acyltransferase family protein n=1 Tax=Cellulomonas palmilytica TaxID=2608402 RepID=UPI001F39F5DB|nr:acyltransferase family protein [Cellulomonas palmilytica]UJP38552.1 acyltransferase [Cellulomonas palmilytica]